MKQRREKRWRAAAGWFWAAQCAGDGGGREVRCRLEWLRGRERRRELGAEERDDEGEVGRGGKGTAKGGGAGCWGCRRNKAVVVAAGGSHGGGGYGVLKS